MFGIILNFHNFFYLPREVLPRSIIEAGRNYIITTNIRGWEVGKDKVNGYLVLLNQNHV